MFGGSTIPAVRTDMYILDHHQNVDTDVTDYRLVNNPSQLFLEDRGYG